VNTLMNFWVPYRCGNYFLDEENWPLKDSETCPCAQLRGLTLVIVTFWLVGWFAHLISLRCRLLKDLTCRQNRKKHGKREMMERRKFGIVKSKTCF
jgi:hypothetical protein